MSTGRKIHVAHPNPALTPGEFGPNRVPRNVPGSVKRAVFTAYGIGLLRRLLYTIDHLVPLELNGTNSQKNLWPQPRREAKIKDRDENNLARAVESGRLSLARAQATILELWR